MSTGWKWITDPVAYADRCTACGQRLRGDSQIVLWTDNEKWHASCLLDKFASVDVLLADPVGDADAQKALRDVWGMGAP